MTTSESEPVSGNLIFLHLPKAGGSALKRVIQRNYRVSESYAITGPIIAEGIEKFRNLSLEHRSQVRLLRGHMPFGLHESLPGETSYITFLRHPVDRVISFYTFVKKLPGHEMFEVANEPGMTLRKFVELSPTPEICNLQVVALSGKGMASYDCDAETLETAKANLRDHFSVVGIMEEFERSLALAGATYGWKPTPVRRINVSQSAKNRGREDEETREFIEEQNPHAMDLYRYARGLFDEQVARRKAEVERIMEEQVRLAGRRALGKWLSLNDELVERLVKMKSSRLVGGPLRGC